MRKTLDRHAELQQHEKRTLKRGAPVDRGLLIKGVAMRCRLVSALTIAVIMSASAAAAGTVLQNITYSFLDGPLSGTVAEVDYTYPVLPPGQSIITYQPTPTGSATYLDAVSESLTSSLLVFSDSQDILKPEPFLSFLFDPAANSAGLMNLEVFNLSSLGLNFVGAPDIETYTCGQNVECVFSAHIAPVPLPAGLPLLAGALGVLVLGARRHRA